MWFRTCVLTALTALSVAPTAMADIIPEDPVADDRTALLTIAAGAVVLLTLVAVGRRRAREASQR